MAEKRQINRKWAILAILLFLGIGSISYFLGIKKSDNETSHPNRLTKESIYFIPMKINGFSSGKIPFLEVKIENETINARIDLGYCGDISLPSEIFKKIHRRKFIKKSKSFGVKGKVREYNIYEIDKISTKSMSFFPVLAEEEGYEHEEDIHLWGDTEAIDSNFGTLGWHLFKNFNVLIDYKNSIFALCDSVETLKKRGYPVDCFTEIPLLLDRGIIEFKAGTEIGSLRCMLDTGSTWNVLNKNPNDSSNSHMIFTPDNVDQYSLLNPDNEDLLIFDPKNILDLSEFIIGGKDFGPITFKQIKSPLEIYAVVGTEFFEHTLTFIDFARQKIYFFEYPAESGE